MTASTDPHRPRVARALFVLIVLGWASVTSAGAASADDDDDDDDDDSSSSVITTWPPTTIEWPPQLAVTNDADSAAQGPIIMPNGQPLPPPPVADPAQPIVPITITAAPEIVPP
jgi:hypothetical protein